jgi:hypothetical protein
LQIMFGGASGNKDFHPHPMFECTRQGNNVADRCGLG